MATVQSYQIQDLDTIPQKNLMPSELAGRVRTAYFSFDTGASGPAVNDVIELVKVPKGARILSIYLNWEAMSSGAGTAGADIGDSGDPDRFVTALNMDAAGSGFVSLRLDGTNGLREPAFGFGYQYPAESRITATVTGEAWAANASLRGFVSYVVD